MSHVEVSLSMIVVVTKVTPSSTSLPVVDPGLAIENREVFGAFDDVIIVSSDLDRQWSERIAVSSVSQSCFHRNDRSVRARDCGVDRCNKVRVVR